MIGQQIGHYKVLSKLGEGGMGQVFVAHDLKLDRRVAVKMLPASMAADADRRERLTREARAVASLNHPNIVTVYSIEDIDGISFVAMELVEGKTLAELLPAKGFPLEKLLTMAIPLADAIAAAHARGITHRDLKPGNVMVTTEGRVKVLDFGLAKLREEAAHEESATSLKAAPLTGEGRIVGTVAYMSPEQAEGRAIDHRTDIFSLGVMLYEMATGERPFKGDSAVSTLSSVLRDTPKPITEINPKLPRDLGKIVRRLLVKDADQRGQNAKDVRIELEELKQELDSGELAAVSAAAAMPAPAATSRVAFVWVGFVILAGIGGWLAYRTWLSGPTRLTPLETSFEHFTFGVGIETRPSLSPDGKSIVYASEGDILFQNVGGQVVINLTKDEPAQDTQPAFSPNGKFIVFRSLRGGTGGLYVMTSTGEGVRKLTDGGFDPTWTPDGTHVIYATQTTPDPESRIRVSAGWSVEVQTEKKTQLTEGDFMQPSVSPHGLRIAYWGLEVGSAEPREFVGNDRDVWTSKLDGSDPVRLTHDAATDWSPLWAPDGASLFFASDRGGSMNLWRVALDEQTGRPLGDPEPVTTPSPYVAYLTRSADGRLFAYADYQYVRNVVYVPFDPQRGRVTGPESEVTKGNFDWSRPDPSADGTQVLMCSYRRQEDIYIVKTDGSSPPRALTNDIHKDRMPRWSPDGKSIVFYSNRLGPSSLFMMRPDGGGLRQIASQGSSLVYPVLSPDGKRVAGSQLAAMRAMIFDLGDAVVTAPSETLPPIGIEDASFEPWSWSKDGKRIAGYSRSTTRVYVYDVESKTYSDIATGIVPSFLDDGRRIVYSNGGRIYLADTVTKEFTEIRQPEAREALNDPRITRDDRMLFYSRQKVSADIWLMTVK